MFSPTNDLSTQYTTSTQGYCLPRVDKLPSKDVLTLEGLRKVVTLGPVSPVPPRPVLPLSHFPKRRLQLSFQTRPRPQSFLKRESNLLPRIWYLSEWWWGARHPGGSEHDRTVFTTPDPPRLRTGGAAGAPGTARSNGSGSAATGGSTSTPSCETPPGNQTGQRGAPRAALPRVLPATPPGEVERLPRPARSPQKSDKQGANPMAGSQPPRPHSRPEQPWNHRGNNTRRALRILPSASVPADRHVSQKPGSPRVPFTRKHRENRERARDYHRGKRQN